MPRPRQRLDARSHLEHLELVLNGIAKYGLCPAIEHELKVLSFVNRQILAKAKRRAARGDRKDLYISPSTIGY